MCGLVGALRSDGGAISQPMLQRMTEVLVHRGPDEQSLYVDQEIGFGFQRLAILDLSPNGHQPMRSPNGRFTMVFNGEIFNYVELRKELISKGHSFKSTGDSEVLLTAYMEWGKECLHRLNGMWACLIFDSKTRTLFGSRDRFGIKPLFYTHVDSHILFASEIKALRSSGLVRAEPDWGIASRFLFEGRIDEDERTFFSGIQQVLPGTYFEVGNDGKLVQEKFWSIDEIKTRCFRDTAEEFAELFEDSVRLRLRSDVPVGVSLSGGLDSTSIICSMARQNSSDGAIAEISAFCFNPEEFDESLYVNDTIRQTQARLNKVVIRPGDLSSELDELLWYHDEPVHSATALVGYKINQQARQHGIKVMLNGQGADESLAGYPSYFKHFWQTLVRTGYWSAAWREFSEFGEMHNIAPIGLLRDTIVMLVQSELSRLSLYRKLSRRKRRKFLSEKKWFTRDFAESLELRDREYETPDLHTTLRNSVEIAPLPLYLRIEDRNSMANSVESRLPFMDYRLVTMAFQLGSQWKMKGSWNKFILRTAMRERIPESVRIRPEKFGFPVPVDSWFRASEMRECLHDLLHSTTLKQSGLYHNEVIEADINRHFGGELNIGAELFDILQFEKWRGALG